MFACVRQPSQGPTFGIKGGAAGGGYSLVGRRNRKGGSHRYVGSAGGGYSQVGRRNRKGGSHRYVGSAGGGYSHVGRSCRRLLHADREEKQEGLLMVMRSNRSGVLTVREEHQKGAA